VGWLATAAWLVTFVVMLANRETRYANRWAWFWLFTHGLAGALIYLWLEPRPLWSRRGTDRDPERRMRGPAGFLSAIMLAVVVSLLTVAVRAALGIGDRTYSGELITPVLTPG
jgi:cytochrome b561